MLEKLTAVEKQLEELQQEEQVEHENGDRLSHFDSREKVEAGLEEVLTLLISKSYEFTDVMRQLIPQFII